MIPNEKVGQNILKIEKSILAWIQINYKSNYFIKKEVIFFIHQAIIYSAILDHILYFVPSTEFSFGLEVIYVLKR